MSPVQPTSTGIRLAIHVQPRASKTEVIGLHGDAIKIRLAAPPVEGAANNALVDFLAEALQVPRSSVAITAGHSARRKVVTVDGLTPAQAAQRLHLGG
jgi:uncharacterized protein (TIGR00251 family)